MQLHALRRCRAAIGKVPIDHRVGRFAAGIDSCEALSQHGFLGKESETVEQIVNWMLKKPFLYEVK